MYIETSSGNSSSDKVFCSWERIDIFQITNISFYYNRHSIVNNIWLKAMGCFRIQLLLADNTWSPRYNITKNDRYRN